MGRYDDELEDLAAGMDKKIAKIASLMQLCNRVFTASKPPSPQGAMQIRKSWMASEELFLSMIGSLGEDDIADIRKLIGAMRSLEEFLIYPHSKKGKD